MAISQIGSNSIASGSVNTSQLGTGRILNFQNLPAGSVLQVVTNTASGALSTSTGGAVSTSNGVQVFSFNFTPLSATSKLIIQTSTINIDEETNQANVCWLAAWYGSTLWGCNSGTGNYTAFGNNLNQAYHSLNHPIASWGTTTQTVQVRAGTDGSSSVYVNGQSYSNYGSPYQTVSCTVWEIAQ